MRKIYLLLFAVTVIVGLNSCEKPAELYVSWGHTGWGHQESNEESRFIDSVFTAEFGKASFGKPEAGSNEIRVSGIKPKQLIDFKKEAKTLAENANSVLAGKTFIGRYTYTVTIGGGEDATEKIDYQYGPKSSK